MKSMLHLRVLCLVGLANLAFVAPVAAAPWGLPMEVNDQNSEVTFEIDSTWHTVHGKTSALSGKVWLEKEDDFSSVRAEIDFPVKQFNTENDSRDERMREVMLEPKFPAVIFKVAQLTGLCTPEELSSKGRCGATLKGKLKILSSEQDLEIPVTLSKEGDGVVVTGSSAFDWSSFGVEDPSIIIARLDKIVTVKFRLSLPAVH